MKQKLTMILAVLACMAGMNAWALAPNSDGVYEIGSADDLAAFAQAVNAGETGLNAVLTADINGYSGTMIGTASVYYAGTFDGQYHKITYTTEPTEAVWGLFRTLTGTVRNLSVAGTITTSQKQVGSIVGFLYGGSVENCISTVDITTSFSGDAGTGGIIASSVQTGSVIKDCVFAGSIKGESANSCAGIAGWTGGSSSLTLTNCLAIGELSVNSKNCDVIARNPGRVTRTNCYYLTAFGNVSADLTKISAEQLASGEVCYLLNGDQSSIQWTQAIATDAIPTPFPTGKKVFAVPGGGYRCDGKLLGETTYSNTDPQIGIPAHSFSNAFCQVCGKPDPDFIKPNAQGFYELGSAADLNWFACMVNEGNNTINAMLTSDINNYAETMIGTADIYYDGIFDGQYHTINFTTEPTEPRWSLFRTMSGTVKNLHATGTITTSQNQVGGIVGFLYGGTIENCLCTVDITSTFNGDAGTGGIIATSMLPNGVIKDCIFAGSIKSETAYSFGGIAGWVTAAGDLTLTNCLTIGEITANDKDGNVIARNPDRVKRTNCYYQNAFSAIPEDIKQITAEQLASGEVCYLLNGEQTSIQWTQTLTKDAYPKPFPNGQQVFVGATGFRCDGTPLGDIVYSNTSIPVTIPTHTFVDGICQVCGQTDDSFVLAGEDGVYTLGTAGQLIWFATKVNNGETMLNARLSADINMQGLGDKFPMIGTSNNPYAGTFDGQFHTISNLNLAREANDVALFSYVKDGCTIQNLILDATCSSSGANYTAGIVSRCKGDHNPLYLQNLGYEGTVTGTGVNSGGIQANSPASGPITVMRNCYSTGKISGSKECAQLSGWVGKDAIIDNCWSAAEVTGIQSNAYYLYRRSSATQTNCYSLYGTQATVVTADQVKSGELCYLLNGNKTTAIWRQSIGYDNYPVLDKARGIVNKIGASGYATQYIADNNVLIPEGITAFTGLIDTPWIALRPLTNIIPAGAAVVLQGKEGYYSFIPVTVDATIEGNDLKGTAEPLEATGSQYVLAEKEGVVGFYQATGTIPAGKAYIEYAGAPVKGFFFGGDETGIENGQWSMVNGQSENIFDLSGRRVEKATKGIYIINGKKVLK